MNTPRKHDIIAETLYGPVEDTPNSTNQLEQQRISGPRSLPVEQIVSNHPIQQTQKDTRFPIFTALGATCISLGALGATGYFLINGNPFDRKAQEVFVQEPPKRPETPVVETPPDLPKEVTNEQELIQILKHLKIKITTEQLKEKSGSYYMEAQRFRPVLDNDGKAIEPFTYTWETMLGHKNKQKNFTTFTKDDEDIIIATLNKAPQLGKITHQGVLPIATTKDSDNPLITYHYYRCVAPKTNNVASISLSSAPNKNIAMFSIQLSQCLPKPDPSQTQP
jgi:hypothetical protein